MVETPQAVPPTVDELIVETNTSSDVVEARRRDYEMIFDDQFERQAVDAQRAWVHLRGLEDHYRHKSRWSWFLIGGLSGMILFQWLLLALVGLGKWDFTKYEWLLPVLLVQNLGQIIGLALVVVKSLFKDIDGKDG